MENVGVTYTRKAYMVYYMIDLYYNTIFNIEVRRTIL